MLFTWRDLRASYRNLGVALSCALMAAAVGTFVDAAGEDTASDNTALGVILFGIGVLPATVATIWSFSDDETSHAKWHSIVAAGVSLSSASAFTSALLLCSDATPSSEARWTFLETCDSVWRGHVPVWQSMLCCVLPFVMVHGFRVRWYQACVVSTINAAYFFLAVFSLGVRLGNVLLVTPIIALLSGFVIWSSRDTELRSRMHFTLLLSLRDRLYESHKARSTRAVAVRKIQKERDKRVRESTVRLVHEATIGYTAHELKNPIHAVLGSVSCINQRHGSDVAVIERQICEGDGDPGAAETHSDATVSIGPDTSATGVRPDCVDPVLFEDLQDVASIEVAALQMAQFVEDVLDHVKLLGGRLDVTNTPVDTRSVMKEVVLEAGSATRDVSFALKVDARVPRVMMTDQTRLKQLVRNGLANAATHSLEGREVSVTVTQVRRQTSGSQHSELDRNSRAGVSTTASASHMRATSLSAYKPPSLRFHEELDFLRVEVSNLGRGLSIADPGILFRPHSFTDEGELVTRATGLGLPICKMLIDLFGGDIGIEDRPPPQALRMHDASSARSVGAVQTVFWFEIPLRSLDSGSPTTVADAARRARSRSSLAHLRPPRATRSGSPLSTLSLPLDHSSDGGGVELQSIDRPRVIGRSSSTSLGSGRGFEKRGKYSASGDVLSPKSLHESETSSYGKFLDVQAASAPAPDAKAWMRSGPRTASASEVTLHGPIGGGDADAAAGGAPGDDSGLQSSPSVVVAIDRVTPSSHAPHVIFVDDESVIRKLGARMLRQLGCTSTILEDGDELAPALKEAAASNRRVDCVLLDIVMRRTNGVDVCREIKADSRISGIPIVAATGNTSEANIKSYLAAGFEPTYLAKPYTIEQLREALNAVAPHCVLPARR